MFRSMLAAALLALPMTAKAENRSPLCGRKLKGGADGSSRCMQGQQRRPESEDAVRCLGPFARAQRAGREGGRVRLRRWRPSLQAGRRRLRQGQDRYFCAQRAMRPGAQGLKISAHGLLETMLDPSVRLATSTPQADPLGRLCVRAVCQGRRDHGGCALAARSQGAAAHPRTDL